MERPAVERPAHDYYEILQVHPKASLPVIKKAYRTLMLELGHHPDQGGSPQEASLMTEAYQVLCDPAKREAYDRAYFARMGRPEPRDRSRNQPDEPAGALVVICPRCEAKNRVRSQELLGVARCSKCHQSLSKLPHPAASLGDRLASWLKHLPRPNGAHLAVSLLLLAASAVALGFALTDGFAGMNDPIARTEALGERGRFDQAAAVLQRALDREPGNPRLHEKLGDVYGKQSMHREALAEYQQAIRLNPTNSYLYTLAASSLMELQRVPEAELSYKQALKLDPHQSIALVALGTVAAKAQRFREAERYFQSALRTQPHADIFYNLGMVYQWDGRPKQAVSSFLQALIADPNHRAAMVSLAALYYEQKRYDQAAAQLIKASQLRHSDLDLHLKLADIYERTGRKPDAIREWEVCLDQGKGDPRVLDKARQALRRLGVAS